MIALSFEPVLTFQASSIGIEVSMNARSTPSNMNASTQLIVVMGVSGSGKSTVAKALADHYGYCYLDGDDFHSESSRMRMASGQPLTDEMRAPWVANICAHLQERAKTQQHCVLAFSGLKALHRDQLRGAGLKTIFLFLLGSKETIQQRLQNRVGHFMAPTLLDSQFESLENPLSEKDVVPVDISGTLSEVIQQSINQTDQHLLID